MKVYEFLSDTSNWITFSFFVALFFVIISVIAIFWHFNRKKRAIKENPNTVETNLFDDYFPYPRKVLVSAKAIEEDGFHTKMNYQYLIERLSRKLYVTFISIIFFSTSFIYILYSTSLKEQITPDLQVMHQYNDALNEIITLENNMGAQQVANIEKLNLKDKEKSNLKVKIFEKTIEYEDELISNVSQKFFNIYYARYIAVRLFIASIMFVLMSYLIKIYFKMRLDKNDLLLKEEALSTLFYLVDSIEGKIETEDSTPEAIKYKAPKYDLLKDKIPDFPLLRLFENSQQTTKSNDGKITAEVIELVAALTSTVEMQKDMIEKIIKASVTKNGTEG